jgi:ketosteroid isomerase-like protein
LYSNQICNAKGKNMHIIYNWWNRFLLASILLVSCSDEKHGRQDLINNPFTQAKSEIREVINSIAKDAEMANIQDLQAIHLNSEKFTKFGPRMFNRQDVTSTNQSEAAHFGSISEFEQEVKDLKIDVFGDIGIATYYPHVSFLKDGMKIKANGRQSLVFLKTENGWEIVHEHGTVKKL